VERRVGGVRDGLFKRGRLKIFIGRGGKTVSKSGNKRIKHRRKKGYTASSPRFARVRKGNQEEERARVRPHLPERNSIEKGFRKFYKGYKTDQ